MRRNRWLLFFLLVWLIACQQENLQRLDFIEVTTGRPATTGPGAVKLTGILSKLSGDPNRYGRVEFGFLLSSQHDPPELNRDTVLRQDGPMYEGFFEASLSGLSVQPDQYFVLAYAILGAREVYGEVQTFTFRKFEMNMASSVEIRSDRARVTGAVFGLDTAGIILDNHGFVYRVDTGKLPEVGIDSVLRLGKRSADGFFSAEIAGLSFNTTYQVRAFAEWNGEVLYSASAARAPVRDGWQPAWAFPRQVFGAAAAVLEGSAYVGAGQERAAFYDDFWVFDPHGNAGLGSWTALPPLPGGGRSEAVAFALGGQLFAGLGKCEQANPGGPSCFRDDLWSFDPAAGSWKEVAPFPATARAGAVAFVIDGAAYVGGGYRCDFEVSTYYDDFYAYIPEPGGPGRWRLDVDSLKIAFSRQSVHRGGRAYAVAVAIGSKGYVGLGDNDGLFALDDWWEFDPDPPNGSGNWRLVDFFPGGDRFGAVGFVLGDQAFIGAGNQFNNAFLQDFWAFRPGRFPDGAFFRQVSGFQARGRWQAVAFAIDGNAYVGLGREKIIRPSIGLVDTVYADFLKYFPLRE